MMSSIPFRVMPMLDWSSNIRNACVAFNPVSDLHLLAQMWQRWTPITVRGVTGIFWLIFIWNFSPPIMASSVPHSKQVEMTNKKQTKILCLLSACHVWNHTVIQEGLPQRCCWKVCLTESYTNNKEKGQHSAIPSQSCVGNSRSQYHPFFLSDSA